MLYWIYTLILTYITGILFVEIFNEKKWKMQIAIAMVLIVFVLRLLQLK